MCTADDRPLSVAVLQGSTSRSMPSPCFHDGHLEHVGLLHAERPCSLRKHVTLCSLSHAYVLRVPMLRVTCSDRMHQQHKLTAMPKRAEHASASSLRRLPSPGLPPTNGTQGLSSL